jgi:hypothetical protein
MMAAPLGIRWQALHKEKIVGVWAPEPDRVVNRVFTPSEPLESTVAWISRRQIRTRYRRSPR